MQNNIGVKDLQGKKIAVLGLGVEGISTVKYLVGKGINVTVLDKKKEGELDEEIHRQIREIGGIRMIAEGYLSNVSEYDVILRSPGIKRDLPELIEAGKNGIV
ncbi:MAG: hypothetical protein HYT10_01695, partial [Candidatus Levybacteria bacterium]|nr:hypothetical protein [Candidatus Levybacteria bacterium]